MHARALDLRMTLSLMVVTAVGLLVRETSGTHIVLGVISPRGPHVVIVSVSHLRIDFL